MAERIIGPHGGYRQLRAYQLAEIIYDATTAFTKLYLNAKSRTVDQMIQAARSGKQNIVEGSMASATSKKTELKLTGVAKASLEELLQDYEDFLRQNRLEMWTKDHEKAVYIRNLRHKPSSSGTSAYDSYRIYVEAKGPENAANVLICLIQQATFLLGRLLRRLERDFASQGGITEKLHRIRTNSRRSNSDTSDQSD
jgi:restriction system protein